jgi:hypothetical protein
LESAEEANIRRRIAAEKSAEKRRLENAEEGNIVRRKIEADSSYKEKIRNSRTISKKD